MKVSKKLLFTSVVALSAAGVLGSTGVMAAETVGTVTGIDGDVKDKVALTAEVTSVDGSQVSFIDVDSGEEYQASFGPSWYTRAYEEGEQVNVVGVVTDGENNENNHNFQVMEVNGETLRESFEGKPAWAGMRGGNGQGMGRNGQHSANFVDADGDGECDNSR